MFSTGRVLLLLVVVLRERFDKDKDVARALIAPPVE